MCSRLAHIINGLLTLIGFMYKVKKLLRLTLQFRVPVFVRVIQHAQSPVCHLQLFLCCLKQNIEMVRICERKHAGEFNQQQDVFTNSQLISPDSPTPL